MVRRTIGLLMAVVAVGTSVIVLLRAEKPRRYIRTRVEQLRRVLPGPQRVRRSAQHITLRVSDLTSDARSTTGQAIRQVKQTGSDLAERAKRLTAIGNQNGC